MSNNLTNETNFGRSATRTDVLSQVLTLIRLRGELVYSANLRAPWSLAFSKGAAHFHFIAHGEVWVTTPGAEPILVKRGDLVLLPHGTGHVISNEPDGIPVEVNSIIEKHFDSTRSLLDYGGEGAVSRIVGGQFNFEGGSLAAVMAALPMVVHIASEDGNTPDWLDAIAHFLVKEAHEIEPGSSLMISRLIDLLVIRTLRTWAANQARPKSWLGGLGEERIGRVLSAIHADPYHAWSLSELANIAVMSRSIFAERFTARVGEAPLQYVKRWKLTLAADMLTTGELKVTQAAQRSGYSSDAAFSRAFKAQFGYAPSQVRHR
jgi:AraC-like DNA-binding protein/mannose-6-phosphate isomerase-like protein (cupin superfamily)